MQDKLHQLHFVGIGGIGMCAIAELLAARGHRVTGSDLREGATVARLRSLGVQVSIGHAADHLGDCDAVVYSSAVRPDNPELAQAEARGIPRVARGAMLAECLRTHRTVAVGGTHGKTTTSSLVAHLLASADLDPTCLIGGRVLRPDGERSGVRVGASDLAVCEADESDGSFLRLAPAIAVVTNVDAEHLDHWGDYEAMEAAYLAFANSVPYWGLAVVAADHPGSAALLPRIARRTATTAVAGHDGAADADWVASELAPYAGGTRFVVSHEGTVLGPADVPLPGLYNVRNALAALAVAHELEVPFERAASALAAFEGVERRFERKGEARGITIVDDYAHHPAELEAVLGAAREGHAGRVVAVFQPHRYTRTRDCWDDFARAFGAADRVLVADVYTAGEPPIDGIDSPRLAAAMRDAGHPDAVAAGDLDAIASALPGALADGDLVLTLGAGDVSSLGSRLLASLRDESKQGGAS